MSKDSSEREKGIQLVKCQFMGTVREEDECRELVQWIPWMTYFAVTTMVAESSKSQRPRHTHITYAKTAQSNHRPLMQENS